MNALAGMEMPRGSRPIVRTAASDSFKASQRARAQEDVRALRKLRKDARASQRGAQRQGTAQPREGSITPNRRDKAPVKPAKFAPVKIDVVA